MCEDITTTIDFAHTTGMISQIANTKKKRQKWNFIL